MLVTLGHHEVDTSYILDPFFQYKLEPHSMGLSKPAGKTCLALMLILAVEINLLQAAIIESSSSAGRKCAGNVPSMILGTPW